MPFLMSLRLIKLVFWHPAHTTNASEASAMFLVRRKSLTAGVSYYNEHFFA